MRLTLLANDLKPSWERVRSDRSQAAYFLDSRTMRTRFHRRFEPLECVTLPCCRDLDASLRRIPHPAGKTELLRLVNDEPTESNSLHASTNLDVDALHRSLASDSKQRSQRRCDRRRIGYGSRRRNREISISNALGNLIECARHCISSGLSLLAATWRPSLPVRLGPCV